MIEQFGMDNNVNNHNNESNELLSRQQRQHQQQQHLNGLKFPETISKIRRQIGQTFKKISQSHFVPACTSHMILSRSDFNSFRIGQSRLDSILNCWAHEQTECTGRLRLIESCAWPDCQRTCPGLRHPDTGAPIDPIGYFSYFGLVSYRQLAVKLKLSESAVRKMGYVKLMKLVMGRNKKEGRGSNEGVEGIELV